MAIAPFLHYFATLGGSDFRETFNMLFKCHKLQRRICMLVSNSRLSKEWKPRATVSARLVMGSLGGGGTAFVFNLVPPPPPPKRFHNRARAHSRPRFPPFLEVGYWHIAVTCDVVLISSNTITS